MSIKMRTALLAVVAATLLSVGAQARDASRSKVLERMEDFRQFFVDFQSAPDSAVPGDLLAECSGVIIMRQYKAGFVFGVKGGDGVIFLHDRATGAWTGPAFVMSGEGSFGFQIGGQAVDAIILIMNQDGIDMLLKTRFKVGVDASAAAGPVGRDAAAKVGPGTALLAYSRAKGLYAGVSFEGGALLNNDKYNRAFYGMDIGLKEILIDRMAPVSPDAYPMMETLQSYSRKNVVEPTPITVTAPSPVGAPQKAPAPGPLPDLAPPTAKTPAAPAPAAPAAPAPVFVPAPQSPAAAPAPAASAPMPTPTPPPAQLPPAATPAPWPSNTSQATLDAEATRAAAAAKAAADAAAKAQAEADAAAAKAAAARGK